MAESAFAEVGKAIGWEAADVDEVGREATSGRILVRFNNRYFRTLEVDCLLGDARRAKAKLFWVPKLRFADLVNERVAADLGTVRRECLAGRSRRHASE